MSEMTVTLLTGSLFGIGSGVVVLVLWHILRHRRGTVEEHYTKYAFSGNLKQTTLLEAVQFLEIGRKEGVLHIYCGRRKGYLSFIDGQIIDAFYRDTTGKEAIFGMLDLEEGDFYFEAKKINHPRLFSGSILDIAFEWDSRKNPTP